MYLSIYIYMYLYSGLLLRVTWTTRECQGDIALSVLQADILSIAMVEESSDQGNQAVARCREGETGRPHRLSLSTVRAIVEHCGHPTLGL
jgi:hypothetical protein